MALTESTMMDLGNPAPAFNLPSTDGGSVSLDYFAGAEALVVLFICNHCPYVVHIAPALAKLADEYLERNIAFVAISSNDAETYPADSFESMKQEKAKRGYNFPYLYDEDQSVALAYAAACTPDIYVFDKERKLAYRGQFDDTRPHRISSGNYDASLGEANGRDLRAALDVLLEENAVPEKQYPSIGCNIKWKDGNAPE